MAVLAAALSCRPICLPAPTFPQLRTSWRLGPSRPRASGLLLGWACLGKATRSTAAPSCPSFHRTAGPLCPRPAACLTLPTRQTHGLGGSGLQEWRVRVLRTDHPALVVPCSALLTHTGPRRFCLSAPPCGKTNTGGRDGGTDPLLQQLNKKPNGFRPSFPPGCIPLLPTYLSRGRGHPPV